MTEPITAHLVSFAPTNAWVRIPTQASRLYLIPAYLEDADGTRHTAEVVMQVVPDSKSQPFRHGLSKDTGQRFDRATKDRILSAAVDRLNYEPTPKGIL